MFPELEPVEVDEREMADSRTGQFQRDGRTTTAKTDDDDFLLGQRRRLEDAGVAGVQLRAARDKACIRASHTLVGQDKCAAGG